MCIGGSLERLGIVREAAGELWGVERDDSALEPPGIFDTFRRAAVATAGLPDGRFDLAYSFMVMEHVSDPESFLRSVRASLRPGGNVHVPHHQRPSLLRPRSACRAVRIDYPLLRIVRKREDVERYHHPLQYRCNVPRVIDRLAARTGFEPPEYVFVEEDGPDDYMSGPLRPALRALQWKRSIIRRPELLLTMIVRMRAADI